MFNIKNAQTVNKTYTKTGGGRKGVSWEIKYREWESNAKNSEGKVEQEFRISETKMSELGIHDGKAFAIARNTEDGTEDGKTTAVAFHLVDEDHPDAKILTGKKGGNKSGIFKASILADHLKEAGVLEDTIGESQYLKLSAHPDDPSFLIIESDENVGSDDEEAVEEESLTEEAVEEEGEL